MPTCVITRLCILNVWSGRRLGLLDMHRSSGMIWSWLWSWHHNSSLATCRSMIFFFLFWEHSAWWQILQVTRHTSTWWQPIRYMHFTECKRARVVRPIHFGSSFKEKFVCFDGCVVVKHQRYVWNRVEDNCPFPLKSFSLILLKPATKMWLFASSSDNIYTVMHVYSHTFLLSSIMCVSI